MFAPSKPTGPVSGPQVRIGTSGWSYDHWDGVLYRPGLPAAKRLARYVEVFDTVELNASFYRWPRDATFEGWRTRLPPGFTMSVKAHRGLSHFRRLATPEPWAERLERCQRALGERREAVLVQLHPDFQRDDARLDHFLQVVPGLDPHRRRDAPPVVARPAVYELLERHRAAYVVTSGPGMACNLCATTDFVYVRMHGPDTAALYAGCYTERRPAVVG